MFATPVEKALVALVFAACATNLAAFQEPFAPPASIEQGLAKTAGDLRVSEPQLCLASRALREATTLADPIQGERFIGLSDLGWLWLRLEPDNSAAAISYLVGLLRREPSLKEEALASVPSLLSKVESAGGLSRTTAILSNGPPPPSEDTPEEMERFEDAMESG